MSRRAGFTYTELLCVATIIIVVWIILLPGMVRARNRADDTNCAQNLRNISWALRMYADDHYGHLPPTLTGLTPRYLYDTDTYRCPRVVAAEKRFEGYIEPAPADAVDYAYATGLAIDDHPSGAVVWDSRPRHNGGANVLYLSGAVKRVSGNALAELERTVPEGEAE